MHIWCISILYKDSCLLRKRFNQILNTLTKNNNNNNNTTTVCMHTFRELSHLSNVFCVCDKLIKITATKIENTLPVKWLRNSFQLAWQSKQTIVKAFWQRFFLSISFVRYLNATVECVSSWLKKFRRNEMPTARIESNEATAWRNSQALHTATARYSMTYAITHYYDDLTKVMFKRQILVFSLV